MYFLIPHPHNYLKVIFICKIQKFTMHVNAYTEYMKKYVKVNE